MCERIQQIEILKLKDNSLTEEHCKLLAKYLSDASELKVLDMSSNFIKDEGACWILSATTHVCDVSLS